MNTVISLKVIVPPEEPEIKDVNGKVMRGLIGPYAESSGLKLTCSTVGGKPRPSLQWFRKCSRCLRTVLTAKLFKSNAQIANFRS